MSWTPGNPSTARFTIWPGSRFAIGSELVGVASTPATAAYPTANLLTAYPFYLPVQATATKLWVHNGTTVTGSTTIVLGIYDAAYALLVSDSFTQAGTSVVQARDITDTLLQPGTYYMAMVVSNNTSHTFRYQHGDEDRARAAGVWTEARGSATLASTATPAIAVSSNIQQFGCVLDRAHFI
jgi:hypothetical protein